MSTTQAKSVVEDDYAELRRNAKQIICFVYTTFGHYPLDLLYVPLIEKDSSHAVGRLACSANDCACFLTVILACIKKKKCRFSSFFPLLGLNQKVTVAMLQLEQ